MLISRNLKPLPFAAFVQQLMHYINDLFQTRKIGTVARRFALNSERWFAYSETWTWIRRATKTGNASCQHCRHSAGQFQFKSGTVLDNEMWNVPKDFYICISSFTSRDRKLTLNLNSQLRNFTSLIPITMGTKLCSGNETFFVWTA